MLWSYTVQSNCSTVKCSLFSPNLKVVFLPVWLNIYYSKKSTFYEYDISFLKRMYFFSFWDTLQNVKHHQDWAGVPFPSGAYIKKCPDDLTITYYLLTRLPQFLLYVYRFFLSLQRTSSRQTWDKNIPFFLRISACKK